MHNWFGIFLAGYLLMVIAELGLSWLNLLALRRHGGRVPDEFVGQIDPVLLSKTVAYVWEKNRFGILTNLYTHSLIIIFIFGGGLKLYQEWFSSQGFSFVIAGWLFFLFLSWAQMLLNLPLDFYLTFKIEDKYGFNTTTLKLWMIDLVKNILLSALLLSVLLLTGFWLIQKFSQTWWLWLWIFFAVFSMLMLYISPYILEPLFNKFVPLQDQDLIERIQTQMGKVGIRVSRIFKMDASKRSKHTNAYFTGMGKVKRIVLFDTLLEKLSQAELMAVLAHEAGHWKKRHIIKRLLLTETIAFFVFYGAFRILAGEQLAGIFHLSGQTFFAQTVILGMLLAWLGFWASPLMNFFPRQQEKSADRFALEMTRAPEDLAQALIKLAKDNLSNLFPHPLYAAFYYSHPPIRERLKGLRSTIKLVQKD